jgi:hypothetical protein
MAEPTPDHIRQRAYELWQLAGRPEDREDEFWYEAERELQNSDSTDYPDERSGAFTEQDSRDSIGRGPLINNIVVSFALLAMDAMLLSFEFAHSAHRALNEVAGAPAQRN